MNLLAIFIVIAAVRSGTAAAVQDEPARPVVWATAKDGSLELPVPDGFRIVPTSSYDFMLEDNRNPSSPRRLSLIRTAAVGGDLDSYAASVTVMANVLGFLHKCSTAFQADEPRLANGWRGKRYETTCKDKRKSGELILLVHAGSRNYGFTAFNLSPADLAAVIGRARLVEADLLKELGAPPTGEVLVSGLDPNSAVQGELPPLPYRRHTGSAGLLIYLLVAAGALGYRFIFDRPKTSDSFLDPGSIYPIQITQRGLLFSVFTVTDAAGKAYRCEFVRVQRAVFLLLGLILAINFALDEMFLRHVLGSGSIVPRLALVPLMLALVVALRVYPKKLRILETSGALLFQANQRWTAFFPNVYDILDGKGAPAASIERSVPAFPRKHWRLKDSSGKVVLRIVEDSFANSLARKMLGHLWGLLRTDFLIYSDDKAVGMIKRSRSLESNLYPSARLFLKAPEGIEPLWILAAVLCVEIADTDRWHPWYG